jgi:integrase
VARDRVLSDAELTAVWRASDRNDDLSKIVRLLILLGQRRQEVGGMCWSELDLEHAVWRIPAERSKNKRPHTMPLPEAAMQVIRQVWRQRDRDYLFGRSERGFNGWNAKAVLDERAGIAAWTLHDLRRSLASGLGDLGVQPHVIEAVLNHQTFKRGVSGTYNKSLYEREKVAALVLWSDHVNALVNGGERKVIPLSAS